MSYVLILIKLINKEQAEKSLIKFSTFSKSNSLKSIACKHKESNKGRINNQQKISNKALGSYLQTTFEVLVVKS